MLGKLGRLKMASGTKDVSEYRELVTMLRMLRRGRRWDVLSLVVNRHVKPLELFDLFQRGRLDLAPTADHMRPLKLTVTRWLEGLDLKPSTRKQYDWTLSHFGTTDTTLGQVPVLLEQARTTALRDGKRSGFINLLSTVRQLLIWAVGERHALLEDVDRIHALRVERRKGNPQDPDSLRRIATSLQELGPMLWAFAMTGMRRDEYFKGRYQVKADRVLIHGTKTKAAERVVFLAYPITPRRCSYDHWRIRLAAVTGGEVRTHDLRYSFQRLSEDAGISYRRIRYYMGHSVQDVGELYGRGRGFTNYLRRDAELFRTELGAAPDIGLAVTG